MKLFWEGVALTAFISCMLVIIGVASALLWMYVHPLAGIAGVGLRGAPIVGGLMNMYVQG